MSKLRVVLDTNVLVSALLRKTSTPRRIYQAFRADTFIIVVSAKILEEIDDVIHRDYIIKRSRMTESDRKKFMLELTDLSLTVEDQIEIKVVKDDPDDNKFITAAVEGKANYIVSGDTHLLDLKEYQIIKIVSPNEFLTILKNYKERTT